MRRTVLGALEFWTEPRHCLVLGLALMGKPTTYKSFGQNQGTVWSLDSGLWGNQLLKRKIKRVLDRTKALYGPRTRAYGETNYLKEFWTEPRHCLVLGLEPMGKPTTYKSFGQNKSTVWSSDSGLWGNQLLKRVLDRTKVLYGPRTRAYGETNYLQEFWTEPRHCMVLGLGPMGKPTT